MKAGGAHLGPRRQRQVDLLDDGVARLGGRLRAAGPPRERQRRVARRPALVLGAGQLHLYQLPADVDQLLWQVSELVLALARVGGLKAAYLRFQCARNLGVNGTVSFRDNARGNFFMTLRLVWEVSMLYCGVIMGSH